MSALRKSALGQNCTIRIPGICTHTPDTVVLCHLNGGGMALKTPDYEGAFGCSACHDVVDGRNNNHPHSRMQIENWFFRGAVETRAYWVSQGHLLMVQSKPEKRVFSDFDEF